MRPAQAIQNTRPKESPSCEGLRVQPSSNHRYQVIWMMVCMIVLWVEMVLAFAW